MEAASRIKSYAASRRGKGGALMTKVEPHISHTKFGVPVHVKGYVRGSGMTRVAPHISHTKYGEPVHVKGYIRGSGAKKRKGGSLAHYANAPLQSRASLYATGGARKRRGGANAVTNFVKGIPVLGSLIPPGIMNAARDLERLVGLGRRKRGGMNEAMMRLGEMPANYSMGGLLRPAGGLLRPAGGARRRIRLY